MCSSYLSKPLRTEEQAIIDPLRSGSHVVVPREPADAMFDAAYLPPRARFRYRAIYQDMVKAGAITLTDRKQEAD